MCIRHLPPAGDDDVMWHVCLCVCVNVVCTESSSTQVVDEHFARSLGSDYLRLLKHPAAPSSAPPPNSSLDVAPDSGADSRPAGHVSASSNGANVYSTHPQLSVCLYPSPPLDNTRVVVIVWRLRGNTIRTALCWIVWHNVHSPQHTYMSSSYRSNRLGSSHWDPYAHQLCCQFQWQCNGFTADLSTFSTSFDAVGYSRGWFHWQRASINS